MSQLLARRDIITFASVLLSGCSLPQFGPNRTIFEADISLDAGDYRIVRFKLDEERSVKFGINVTEGPNVDVFFLSRDQLTAYREDRAFEYRYTSGLNVSGGWTEDSDVPAGRYAIVFDNTNRGEAVPDGQPTRGHAWVEVQPVN